MLVNKKTMTTASTDTHSVENVQRDSMPTTHIDKFSVSQFSYQLSLKLNKNLPVLSDISDMQTLNKSTRTDV